MTAHAIPPIGHFGETKPDSDPAPPSHPAAPDANSRLCSHPDHEICAPDNDEPRVTPLVPLGGVI